MRPTSKISTPIEGREARHTMGTWTVDVGFTTSRPVIPDQFFSRVIVAADTEAEAIITACGMVMRPGVQMPTSTEIITLIL